LILRSVIRHVRDQNWFAVFLDFLIVVVGVFIGLQVANWNEARQFDAQEQLFLAQLRDEIEHNIVSTEHQEGYTEAVVEAGKRTLDYLESGPDCADQCTERLIDVFHATQVWGTGFRRGTYHETGRLGIPTDPELRKQVDEFYLYLEGWDVVTGFTPAFRESARGQISPTAFEHLWSDCYSLIDANLEVLTRDCVDDLDPLDARAILQAIHAEPGIVEELRFWLGQNISARQFFPSQRAVGGQARDAITRTLEPRA
jgi:hypothetical protein